MIDLRSIQRPFKSRYREAPEQAIIRTRARCVQTDCRDPRTSLLEVGPLRLAVGAHEGVGGPAAQACSGDLLLGALAACQQITTQMVASAMGIELESCEVVVSGELDLRGTLGLNRGSSVGYRALKCDVVLSAPAASSEQLEKLGELVRRFCVVHATLQDPPSIEVGFSVPAASRIT